MNEMVPGSGSVGLLSEDALLSVLERLSRVEANLIGVTIGTPTLAAERVFVSAKSELGFLWSSRPGIHEVGIGELFRFGSGNGHKWPEVVQHAGNVCGKFQGVGIGACAIEPRFYGGVSFVPGEATSAVWNGFLDYDFVLPRILYHSNLEANRACLTLFATRTELESSTKREELAQCLYQNVHSDDEQKSGGNVTVLQVLSARRNPNRDSWNQLVQEATRLLATGELEKVVLARELILTCIGVPNISRVLRRLLGRKDGSVCFAFRCGAATFLGATPERLVSRQGSHIYTEALAGSAAADDPVAIDSLLNGEKDRREHAIVVNEIVSRLLALGAVTSVPEAPELCRFGPVVHLRTSIKATRLDSPHVLVIGDRLHPTPAVAGIPTESALEFIRRNEPFQRGRYAGPVGWFDCNGDGELVVALRSGLIRGCEVRLFAGAGLVVGSEPSSEWRETELKFGSFLDALGLCSGSGLLP
jgi:menaquinone-specific isochorismate synthase